MTTTHTGDPARRAREAALQKRIGEHIRAARLDRRVLQEELAAALGLERPTLSRYERGERSIPVTILLDTAAFLGVPLEQLLGVAEGGGAPERPALSLPAAIAQQAGLTRIIDRLSARPDAIPYVDGLLDTLEAEHAEDRA